MRAKFRVRETALYEVWLDVEDPHDQTQLEEAWTNLDRAAADAGMYGYEDRGFDLLALDHGTESVLDEYAKWLDAEVTYAYQKARVLRGEGLDARAAQWGARHGALTSAREALLRARNP